MPFYLFLNDVLYLIRVAGVTMAEAYLLSKGNWTVSTPPRTVTSPTAPQEEVGSSGSLFHP